MGDICHGIDQQDSVLVLYPEIGQAMIFEILETNETNSFSFPSLGIFIDMKSNFESTGSGNHSNKQLNT